jgi:hypothetical protein
MTTDNSPYTIEFRILAACWWHESDQTKAAMRQLRQRLSERYSGESPRGSVIREWEVKLFNTGSIADEPRCGRPISRNASHAAVSESLHRSPKKSLRKRSAELDLPVTTLRRVLVDDLQCKPWRPVHVQFLSPEDRHVRTENCRDILTRCPTPQTKNRVFFSDECAVYADAKMNNVVWWSKENPHFTDQVLQHPPKLMIWAAMSDHHLIGPIFVEGRITSQRYIQLLQENVLSSLESIGMLHSAILQQDGAPPHTANATRDFLNAHFPNRWIGKFGPTPWPPRSPDLSSCDNALWGLIKPHVYAATPKTAPQLKDAIISAFSKITPRILHKIHKRSWRRIQLCVDLGGLQVDPYD